ncbi:hypothetical protein DL768_000160 [Monosporascus sp. mg162]|nr:hypothetical protein DL768_000160 [Monosporascus sp. mg162]
MEYSMIPYISRGITAVLRSAPRTTGPRAASTRTRRPRRPGSPGRTAQRQQGVIPPDGFWKSVLVNEPFPGPLFGLIVVPRAEKRRLRRRHRSYHGERYVGLPIPFLADFDLPDWWHEDYFTVVEEVMAPGFPGQPYSDNNQINGRMNFDCAKGAARTAEVGNSSNTATANINTTTTMCPDNAGLSKFRFQSGKRHRLRHAMTVIAQDPVEVQPYETRVDAVVRDPPLYNKSQSVLAARQPGELLARALALALAAV